MSYILVFIGGGLGSAARYFVNTVFKNFTNSYFPFATLTVNVVGSFLMGIVTALIAHKFFNNSEQMRLILTVGFLGGFTTFSSFSIETLTLLGKHQIFYAFTNVAANFTFGLLAAYFGIILMKNIL